MRKKRILLVEDMEEICSLISLILTDYIVDSAQTVACAKELINRGEYDLFLLDTQLPDGNGLELCGFIRTTQDKAPVLILSGYLPPTKAELDNLGAQGFLYKGNPDLMFELENRVSELICQPDGAWL